MAKTETFDAMIAAWVDENPEAQDAIEENAETEAEAEESAVEDTAEEEAESEEESNEESLNDDEESENDSDESNDKDESKEEAPEAKTDEEDKKAKESSEREAQIRASMQADIDAYNKLYPNEAIEKIDDIPKALDFARMRRGGLSVEEAARYVRAGMKRDKSNGKEHIKASSAVKAGSHGIEGMTSEEYAIARSIFGDMPKKELEKLYNKTKST